MKKNSCSFSLYSFVSAKGYFSGLLDNSVETFYKTLKISMFYPKEELTEKNLAIKIVADSSGTITTKDIIALYLNFSKFKILNLFVKRKSISINFFE